MAEVQQSELADIGHLVEIRYSELVDCTVGTAKSAGEVSLLL